MYIQIFQNQFLSCLCLLNFYKFCYTPAMCRVLQYLRLSIHPSWQLYAGFVGIIFGVVFTVISNRILCMNWWWLVLVIFLLLCSLHWSRRYTLCLAFIAGLIVGNHRLAPEVTSQSIWQQLVGQEITIMGKIKDDPDNSASQITLYLSQLQYIDNQDERINLAGTFYIKLNNSGLKLERSDILTLQGTLGAGFGTFAGTFYRPKLIGVSRADTGDVFARLKADFAEQVRKFIPSPAAGLGLGYLVGLKAGLPDDLADTLRAVGMTHVIVASGAHLGILVGAARKIFGKLSKFSGLLSSLLLISIFVFIVGFTPSMTRAALVSSLSLSFGYFGRRFTPLRLLIFVAMLTLLISPLNCLNLGWQLSFASFTALLLVAPRLQKFFYGGKKPPWLANMIITSLATTITCAPILIYSFGTLSLLSFIANLFILPTLPYAMLLVFLTGALGFAPLLASFSGWLSTVLLRCHIWLVKFLSEKSMFIFELPSGNIHIFWLYIPVILILCLPKVKRWRSHAHLKTRKL